MDKKKRVIHRGEFLDDLYFWLQNCDDPAINVPHKPNLIRLNKRSVGIIIEAIEDVLKCYMSYECGPNETLEIRPFKGLVLKVEREEPCEKVNPLTGETFFQQFRLRIRAYVPRYWQRIWSNLKP